MKSDLMFLGLFLLFALTVTLLPNTLAIPSDNATIDVEIGSVAELRLNTTGFTGIDFGSVNPAGNSSGVLIRAHNVGSTTLSDLYAIVDTMEKGGSNPRGSAGSSTDWAATNFLALANDTSSPEYFYVGKIAWNYSTDEDSSNFTLDTAADAWGEYWAGGDTDPGDHWYWQLNGSVANNDWCNESEATLKINNARGDMDVSSGTSMTNEAQGEDWAVFTVGSGPWTDYCVYAYYNCEKIYITRWDLNSTFAPACSKEDYIHPPNMSPGNYYDFYLKEIIPPGIPSGSAAQTNLRIYASTT
ncbi:MAG: hypothetical protein GF368_03530 [Candidatus Aenigmarchaeota archaeon]|nr:hypothetical protein [Candidatus Aenigmarchaeota archaeon]